MDTIATDEFPTVNICRRHEDITLGKLFRKNKNNEYINFDSNIRENSYLKYRIPEHQRFPQWTKKKKIALIDSIFKNYAINGIMVSQHFQDIGNGHIIEYYDIEDGQTRLSVLQQYHNNKFEYCELLFSELEPEEKNRFENYKISMEVLSPADSTPQIKEKFQNDIHYMFERFQLGQPLKDADLFWNRSDTPFVAYARELIESDIWRNDLMGTTNFSNKNRNRLADVCGLIASLAYGRDYITKSFKRLTQRIKEKDNKCIINIKISHKTKNIIAKFLRSYFDICDEVYIENPLILSERKRSFWNLAKELGMIIWDFMDNGNSLKNTRQMWIDIINIDRNVDNFMRGSKTLWNGMKSQDIQNTGNVNIGKRVNRVRQFYNMDTRQRVCETYGIIWNHDE